MTKLNQLLGLAFILLFFASCAPDDEPAPTCTEAGIFEVPADALVVNSTLNSDVSNEIFWVCDGGALTLSGQFNTILVSKGGLLELNGSDNMSYILGEGEIIVNGTDEMLWLNGDSKATINGSDNYLNYYKTGMLIMYGERNVVDDICGNVQLDFSKAPASGCQ